LPFDDLAHHCWANATRPSWPRSTAAFARHFSSCLWIQPSSKCAFAEKVVPAVLEEVNALRTTTAGTF